MPAILGIPWLANILITIGASFLAFFLRFFTRRIAFVFAAIAAIILLTTIMITAMYTIVAPVSQSLSTQFGGTGFQVFMPHDWGATLGVWVSARLLHWVYSWNVTFVQMKLF